MYKFIFNIFVFLSIVLLWTVRVTAQEKKIKFNDELCVYEGVFDSNSFTQKQLEDTYKLIQGYYGLYTNDELQLEDNYTSIRGEINSLEVVETPYFVRLKDSLLNYIDLTYRIKKIEIQARRGNIQDLIKYYQDNKLVKLYSEALMNGGQDLLRAYEYLTKEQMKNNGAPQRLWNEYLQSIKSPNAHNLAFDRVLTYGWWNAINNLLPHIQNDGTQFEEFLKLFTKVNILDCDEL